MKKLILRTFRPRSPASAAIACLALLGLGPAAPAAAGTTSYGYDALGRLIRVQQVGTGAYAADYGYDKAGNRTRYAVSGASAGTGPATGAGIVVVPFRNRVGVTYRIIPVPPR